MNELRTPYRPLFLFFYLFLFHHLSFSQSLKDNKNGSPVLWPDKLNGFMENKGQVLNTNLEPVNTVLFKAETPGIDLYITTKGLTYVLLDSEEKEEDKKIKILYEKIELELLGADILKQNIVKEEPLKGSYRFYNADENGFIETAKYNRLTFKNIYPGIDWILYNAGAKGFKYDFIIRAGADPSQIKLIYRALSKAQLNAKGEIVLNSKFGSLTERAPVCFTRPGGDQFDCTYKLISSRKTNGLHETIIGFQGKFPALSTNTSLVIDPQLNWATFYGGNSFDGTLFMDNDAQGNMIAVGYGGSTNLPLQNNGTFYQTSPGGSFILKFSNNGMLVWATYFGNFSNINLSGVATDPSGNIFICGATTTSQVPLVNSGSYFQGSVLGPNDAIISKFDGQGNLIWSTLFGGSGADNASTLDTDAAGNVFLMGTSNSTNFPLQNAGTYFEPVITGFSSGFATKFDNNGNLLWSTYLKGALNPLVTTDVSGNVFIIGSAGTLPMTLLNPGSGAYYQSIYAGGANDLYIQEFDNNGSLLWSTYYGGSNNDFAGSLCTDRSGNLFVSGYTTSGNLPMQNAGTYFQGTINSTVNAFPDIFISKFSSTGALQWATYFGGSRADLFQSGDNMAIDTCGQVYLAFTTSSRNIITQAACDGGYHKTWLDTSLSTTNLDNFIVRFSNSGNLLWSTYFGGDGDDFRSVMATDKFNNLFVSGEWTFISNANSYPAIAPSAQSYTASFNSGDDAYMTRFSNVLPVQSFTYGTNFCVSDSSQLPLIPPGFLSGGTYSSVPGLSLNPQSGKIFPASSSPGTYTINYLLSPCYCPGSPAQVKGSSVVNIHPLPLLSITGNTTLCIGQKTSFTASGASQYTWSTAAQGAVLSLTAPLTPGALSYTVSGTSAYGCLASAQLNLNISECLGIYDITETGIQGVSVFPNPHHGEFSVKSERAVNLQLLNSSGLLIKEFSLSAGSQLKIEQPESAPGVYLLVEKTSQKGLKLVFER